VERRQAEDDLEWVRHELEILRFTRTTWGNRPLDAARYRELCEIERELVESSRVA